MSDWNSPIPKIVHLIWIGTNPYPDYFLLFLERVPEFPKSHIHGIPEDEYCLKELKSI